MPHPLNSKVQSLLSYLLCHHRVDQKGLFQEKTPLKILLHLPMWGRLRLGVSLRWAHDTAMTYCGLTCFFPQKFICWSSNHTQNVTEVGGRTCKEVIKVKNGVIRVGPTPRGLLSWNTDRYRGRTMWGHGKKRAIYNRGQRPQMEPALLPPWSGTPASRTVRKYVAILYATQCVVCFGSPSRLIHYTFIFLSAWEKRTHWTWHPFLPQRMFSNLSPTR